MKYEFNNALDLEAGAGGGLPLTQQMLESASYGRDGSTLVLQFPDGTAKVVPGYFDSLPPASLVADNGAFLSGETVELLAGPELVRVAQSGGGSTQGQSAPIGKVETLEGSATVQRAGGGTEELTVGTPVYQGDVVAVSDTGKLGITFADNSVFSLSNGGTMALNEMVYNPGGSSNKMLFSLVKGSLGFVTGEVAGSGGVEVETPVAVMAIRGTTPLAVQLEDGSYAILSAEGTFSIVPKLPSGQLVQVTSGQGAYIISADGTTKLVPITDAGLQGLVGAILNHLRASTQEKTERETNDTGSPFFDTDARFAGLDGETLLLKLAELLAPLADFLDDLPEPDENGNYPPVFLIADNDTATPPPIPETDGRLVATGTLTVLDANQPDSVTTEVLSVEVAGTTNGLGSDNAALLAMLEVVPGVADADAGDLSNVFWTFDSGNEAFDYLAVDETLMLTYKVIGRDGAGALDEITFVVVIDGTNDRPQITAVQVVGAVTEDAATVADNPNTPALEAGAFLTSDGTITFVDVDVSDRTSSSVALTGVATTGPAVPAALQTALAGAVVLTGDIANANSGTVDWTFALDNSLVQYLAIGETVTLTYTISVTDDSGVQATDTETQDVTITITGTNDVPQIESVTAPASQAEVAGDSSLQDLLATGSMDVSDVDYSDVLTGHVVGDATALYNGNAVPVENSVDVSQLVANAALTFDAAASSLGVVQTLDFTFAAADVDLDWLRDGDVLTLDFIVEVGDGTTVSSPQTVRITITGSNDVPEITAATNPASIDEVAGDSSAQDIPAATGTITISDQDLGDTLTVTVTGDATALLDGGPLPVDNSVDVAALVAEAAISFDALVSDGEAQAINWSWDPAAADLDWLRDGQVLTITYTAQVDDGSGNTGAQDLVITITGSNDVPEITAATNPASIGEVAGDSSAQDIPATTGTITISDQDLGDTLTVTVTGDATALLDGGPLPVDNSVDVAALMAQGAISFDALVSDGEAQAINWTWDPAAADLDWLRDGQVLTITYTAQVDDGSGNTGAQDLVITITGSNDVPEITAATNPASIGEVAGDSSAQDIPATTGTITISDQDLGDTLTVTVTGDATALLDGGPLPVDNSVDVAALVAQGAISFDSLVSDGEAQAINWTWDPAAADLDWLRDGQVLTITYTAQVDDGSGNTGAQDLVITITGSNDVPVVSSVNPEAEVEGNAGSPAPQVLDLWSLVTASDVDLGETPALVAGSVTVGVAATSAPTVTSLITVNPDGTVSYDLADFDFLAQGESAIYDISFDVASGPDTVPQVVSLTIFGSNDAPTAEAGPQSVQLVEAGGIDNADAGTDSATIALALDDVDGTPQVDTAWLTANGWSTADGGDTYSKQGTYGTATLTVATAVILYALANDLAATEALAKDEAVSDSFDVQVTDGLATATATAVFNITGSEDIAGAPAGNINFINSFNAVGGSMFTSFSGTAGEPDTFLLDPYGFYARPTINGFDPAEDGLSLAYPLNSGEQVIYQDDGSNTVVLIESTGGSETSTVEIAFLNGVTGATINTVEAWNQIYVDGYFSTYAGTSTMDVFTFINPSSFEGVPIITGFDPAQDVIDLSNVLAASTSGPGPADAQVIAVARTALIVQLIDPASNDPDNLSYTAVYAAAPGDPYGGEVTYGVDVNTGSLAFYTSQFTDLADGESIELLFMYAGDPLMPDATTLITITGTSDPLMPQITLAEGTATERIDTILQISYDSSGSEFVDLAVLQGISGAPVNVYVGGMEDADQTIVGTSNDDYIFGGSGNDTLSGAEGADTLTGNAGSDVFVLDDTAFTGTDTITDYVIVEDFVDLSALLEGTGANAANLGDYVKLTAGTSETQLSLDQDADPGTANEVVATFTNAAMTVNVIFDEAEQAVAINATV